ncbi:MAG: DUF302 domain-containing protein [Gemmobacter sp.]|uniref:DUF302 domain-containing protein n=1 Tax=Gemmobacter sp. TaxID=1898957 RepID=UPI0039197B6B
MFRSALLAASLALAAPAHAEFISRTVEGSFADVAFALENAIVGRGLVIDYVSHVGDMLERTRADVGGSVTLFTAANVYQFCSATLSRKMMEADPANIRFCPYGIVVMEQPDAPGKITLGFDALPEGPMQEVQALLAEIVAEAAGD